MAEKYTIYRINSIFTLVFGCPANLFLIWLILCRTSSTLRIWSRVLLQNALIDLTLILVTFAIHLVPASEGPNVYMVLLGPFANVQNVTLQYAACYFSMFLTEFGKYAVAVPYVYRWLVICRSKEMSICKYTYCLTIPALFSLLHDFFLFNTIYRQANNSVMNSDTTELYLYAFTPGKDPTFDSSSGFSTTISSCLTFAIVVACNCLIWHKSRQAIMPAQQHSADVSRQVGRVLLIQATIPFVLQTIPTIFNPLRQCGPRCVLSVLLSLLPNLDFVPISSGNHGLCWTLSTPN